MHRFAIVNTTSDETISAHETEEEQLREYIKSYYGTQEGLNVAMVDLNPDGTWEKWW